MNAKEIWDKTNKLSKLKKKLAVTTSLVFNEDKIDCLLEEKDRELNKFNRKLSPDFSQVTKADTEGKKSMSLRSQVQLNRLKKTTTLINVDG